MKGVTKISVCDDISLITFNGIGSDLKFISDVFTTLAAAGINMDMISQTAPTGDKISVSFTVCGHDLIKVLSLIKNYTEKYPKFKPLVTGSNRRRNASHRGRCRKGFFGCGRRRCAGTYDYNLGG
ncbi:MAG: hypothetical protein RR879_06630 [Hydrogenoanaerobacterium sp.]